MFFGEDGSTPPVLELFLFFHPVFLGGLFFPHRSGDQAMLFHVFFTGFTRHIFIHAGSALAVVSTALFWIFCQVPSPPRSLWRDALARPLTLFRRWTATSSRRLNRYPLSPNPIPAVPPPPAAVPEPRLPVSADHFRLDWDGDPGCLWPPGPLDLFQNLF